MNETLFSARRQSCARCLRAASVCLCPLVRPCAPALEVLILQHPLEVGASKGTGRLLHLCLTNSMLLTGERFVEDELHAALHADGRSPVLLYPG
ncbi:MAG TPA: DTW domain-containing protein, partial [Telluria sp.]|nr:DTW domain-containing protein [Telluria sp.]